MKPTAVFIAFAFVIFIVVGVGVCAASVNQQAFPKFAMPKEHISYTISEVNGVLWAKIDGEYPIYTDKRNLDGLPMLYPMPPNATNIAVTLDGKDLAWSNYTQAYPSMLHKTAIGDWGQIYCLLENISDAFTMRIHYEHPLETINGSYVFLYDLNIAQYLSAENPTSTASFTIQFETDIAELHVYTAPPNSSPREWEPKEYNLTQEGPINTLKLEIQSQYATDLPGDLVIVFASNTLPATPKDTPTQDSTIWVALLVFVVVLISVFVYVKRESFASCLSSRKSASQVGT